MPVELRKSGINDVSPSGSFRITIPVTKVGAGMVDRPIKLNLGISSGATGVDTSDIFLALGSNKLKLKVTLEDRITQCYVEVSKWDYYNREGIVFVKVPSISGTFNTILYLFYDNNMTDNTLYVGVTGSLPAQTVWENHFVAVYHFAEQGDGTAGEIKDSTKGVHHGTGHGTGGAPSRTIGPNGSYSMQFNGYDHYISVPNHATLSVNTTGYLTVSVLMNPSTLNFTAAAGYMIIWQKGDFGSYEWQATFYPQSSDPGHLYFHFASPNGAIDDDVQLWDPTGAGITGKNAFGPLVWNLCTCMMSLVGAGYIKSRLNRSPWIGFIAPGGQYDAQDKILTNPGAMMAGGSQLTIGSSLSGGLTEFYSGLFAELRISDAAREEDWISLDYYDLLDLLVTYG